MQPDPRADKLYWLEILVAASILVILLCVAVSHAQSHMDLPVPPPKLGDPPPVAPPRTPIPTEDDGDDPRDTPPPTFFGEEIDAESDTILYVLDRSGSMALEGRIEKVKQEFIRSVMGLSDNMQFFAVFYDCGVNPFPLGWAPATNDNKVTAAIWAGGVSAGGATGTGPAVALGLASKRENLTVVLLTDGAPNCGVPEVYDYLNATPGVSPAARDTRFNEAHRRLIREANTQGAAINVFGIQALGLYRSFCQSVAQDSGGSYVDIP